MNLRLKSVGNTIWKNPLLQLVSEYPSYWNNLLISRSNVIVRIVTTVLIFSRLYVILIQYVISLYTCFLVSNFASAICVLSINVKLYSKKNRTLRRIKSSRLIGLVLHAAIFLQETSLYLSHSARCFDISVELSPFAVKSMFWLRSGPITLQEITYPDLVVARTE